MQAIKTTRLVKQYKNIKAVDGLDLEIRQGELFSLLGVNGAGKTTLIRLACGLQYQNSGDLTICGVKNIDSKINKIREKFGAIVETPALHLNMTAADNLKLQLDILGVKDYKKS